MCYLHNMDYAGLDTVVTQDKGHGLSTYHTLGPLMSAFHGLFIPQNSPVL